MKTVDDSQSNEPVQGSSKKTRKKIMIAVIAFAIVIITAITVTYAVSWRYYFRKDKETRETIVQDTVVKTDETIEETIEDIVFPYLTNRGVAPFLIGASSSNIPLKGDYYDTIIWHTDYYLEAEGCPEITEKEYRDLLKKEGGVFKELSGDVMLGEEHLFSIVVERSKISALRIYSCKFKFENGIHIGTPADSIYSLGGYLWVTSADGLRPEFFVPRMKGRILANYGGTLLEEFMEKQPYDRLWEGCKVPLSYAKECFVEDIRIW